MGMYSPQDLLDEINDIDVPGVFAPTVLTAKERLTRIKLVRQELRIAKKRLKAEQNAIKKRWDGRNRYEAEQERLELIPYSLIDAHMDVIEAALVKMETALKLNEPLPPAPPDDLVIVGSGEYGQYMLMTIPEAAVWEREQKAKAQAQLKQRFSEARQLIDRKQYAPARRILQAINHSQAREWLHKVDRLEQKAIADGRRKNRRRFVGCVTFLGVLIILAGLIAVFQRPRQPSQISALPTATQFNTVTPLPITPQFEQTTTANPATLDAEFAQNRQATESAMIEAALTEISVTRAASVRQTQIAFVPSATITDTPTPTSTPLPTSTPRPTDRPTPTLSGVAICNYDSVVNWQTSASSIAFRVFDEDSAQLAYQQLSNLSYPFCVAYARDNLLNYIDEQRLFYQALYSNKFDESNTHLSTGEVYFKAYSDEIIRVTDQLLDAEITRLNSSSGSSYTSPSSSSSSSYTDTSPSNAGSEPSNSGSGATALCNDGTYSYAAHHQGACSHHGGVAIFYR